MGNRLESYKFGIFTNKCAICGKEFTTYGDYAYKRNLKKGVQFFCSYGHMRIWDAAHAAKLSKIKGKPPIGESKNKRIYKTLIAPTTCQWSRFHDKWICENKKYYKTIELMLEKFNKKFLLNISKEDLEERIKYLDDKDIWKEKKCLN